MVDVSLRSSRSSHSVKNVAAAMPSYGLLYIVPWGEVLPCSCNKMTNKTFLHRLENRNIYSLAFLQRVSQSRRESASSIETSNLACSGPENVLGSCFASESLVLLIKALHTITHDHQPSGSVPFTSLPGPNLIKHSSPNSRIPSALSSSSPPPVRIFLIASSASLSPLACVQDPCSLSSGGSSKFMALPPLKLPRMPLPPPRWS